MIVALTENKNKLVTKLFNAEVNLTDF